MIHAIRTYYVIPVIRQASVGARFLIGLLSYLNASIRVPTGSSARQLKLFGIAVVKLQMESLDAS